MNEIKIKLEHAHARMPAKAHESDACWDVWAVSREIKDGYIHYSLGFSTEIPEGWAGYFYPRSSISNYDLVLCNGTGIIDAGFRGVWSARFRYVEPMALGGYTKEEGHDETDMSFYGPQADYAKIYETGDRIGQIQFLPLPTVSLTQCQDLSPSTRASGGFGSTGNS